MRLSAAAHHSSSAAPRPARRPAPLAAAPLPLRPAAQRRRTPARAAAGGDSGAQSNRSNAPSSSSPVYQGVYGPWCVEKEDEIEVLCYRLGLSATAVSLAGSAAAGLLLAGSSGSGGSATGDAGSAAAAVLDPLAALGAAGLGVSVFLIHVYVTPLKRFLQVTWVAGVAGAAYLWAAKTGGQPVALYVAENPWAVWLVGPYFASLTGVAVKEGFCYGKPEAAAIALLLPLLLLGHLSQLLPPAALRAVMGTAAGAVSVFAARKYTQAVKDDIGDKSIFEFRKLPEGEQEALVARLRAQMQQQQQLVVGAVGEEEEGIF